MTADLEEVQEALSTFMDALAHLHRLVSDGFTMTTRGEFIAEAGLLSVSSDSTSMSITCAGNHFHTHINVTNFDLSPNEDDDEVEG